MNNKESLDYLESLMNDPDLPQEKIDELIDQGLAHVVYEFGGKFTLIPASEEWRDGNDPVGG